MSIPTYRAYGCADGKDAVVAAVTRTMWEGLCRALGVARLTAEPRFADNELHREHRAELDAVLERAIGNLDSAEAVRGPTAEGVPSAPINTMDTAPADPQVRHRDVVVQLTGRPGEMRAPSNPVKVTGVPREQCAPPRLGAVTAAVADLARSGAVRLGAAGDPGTGAGGQPRA